MLTMQAMHPDDPPSFYLFSMGVDPDLQGRGLGGVAARSAQRVRPSRVSRLPGVEQPAQPALYERHGSPVGAYAFPDGPVATAMWREPGSPAVR